MKSRLESTELWKAIQKTILKSFLEILKFEFSVGR